MNSIMKTKVSKNAHIIIKKMIKMKIDYKIPFLNLCLDFCM